MQIRAGTQCQIMAREIPVVNKAHCGIAADKSTQVPLNRATHCGTVALQPEISDAAMSEVLTAGQRDQKMLLATQRA